MSFAIIPPGLNAAKTLATLKSMFRAGYPGSPSMTSLPVSSWKVEKVVYSYAEDGQGAPTSFFDDPLR
jgi:hypothetical protein